ncbi:MAG: CBS domain-containing protein [Planctomycetota bacterium]|jgi:acetoin utilization protein AcuB|nr:CBS domain-containing protein [Planctomycetota bacterium]
MWFFGLGDRKIKNPHDAERDRRVERDRKSSSTIDDMERRSWEKVQEILLEQQDYAEPLPEIEPDLDVRNHPVGEIMSENPVTINFDDTVLTVKGIFSRVRFHHLPVVDEEGGLIGIISDRDFLASVSPFVGTVNEQRRDIELLRRKVGLIMTRKPSFIASDTTIAAAIRIMNSFKISCLPVVVNENMRLLGLVTWKDIVRAFCPEPFHSKTHESQRLKAGVNVRPRSTDSGRIIASDGNQF